MIYDTLNNLPNYLGLCSSLDSVIEFIMHGISTTCPPGAPASMVTRLWSR